MTKSRLGLVLHLIFVEDGVQYQIIVETHWITVSFKLPHVINLFRQLISSVFFSRLMNSWPPRTTAQRRILWRWNRLLWASLQLLTRPCVDQSERLLRPEAMTLHVMFWLVLVGPVASMLAPLHGPSECHLCSFTGEEKTTTFRNSCKKRKALVILRLNRLFGPWALSIEYRKLFWIAILLLHLSFLICSCKTLTRLVFTLSSHWLFVEFFSLIWLAVLIPLGLVLKVPSFTFWHSTLYWVRITQI